MSLRDRAKARIKSFYCNKIDVDEAMRKRAADLERLRKYKLEESFIKKRRDWILNQPPQQQLTAADLEKQDLMECIPLMVQGVWFDDPAMQMDSITQFRNLLSIGGSLAIEQVIEAGVVPRFVEFLGRHEFPELQLEAAWVLSNVASGKLEHTRVVIEHGAVPMFVRLLSSSIGDIREQAVFALGNVAAALDHGNFVLSYGALLPLFVQLNRFSKLSMLRNATWTLSKFYCRRPPAVPFDQVKPALPVLQQLIRMNDDAVLTNACWALSYISDGPNDVIQAVIDAAVCPRLVELLIRSSAKVLIPALRTVGNISRGDYAQTQYVIDNQVLPCLLRLLEQNHEKSIKEEACRTISNVTAGNRAQIQSVIEANIIQPLVHLLQHAEFDIKDAAWAILNATSGGSHEQIRFLVSQGCIKLLSDLLICPDPDIVTVCLEGLENILKVGEADKEMGMNGGINLYGQMIEENGGLDKIRSLKAHDNHKICEKALKILERYWA